MGSKKYSLNGADLKKLGLNTLFVSLAAGLTYLGAEVGNIDWCFNCFNCTYCYTIAGNSYSVGKR